MLMETLESNDNHDEKGLFAPGDRVKDHAQGLNHTVKSVKGNKITTTTGAELHTAHVSKI